MTYTVHTPHTANNNFKSFKNLRKARAYARSLAEQDRSAVIQTKNDIGGNMGTTHVFKSLSTGRIIFN